MHRVPFNPDCIIKDEILRIIRKYIARDMTNNELELEILWTLRKYEQLLKHQEADVEVINF